MALVVKDFAGISQLNCKPIWNCQCDCGRMVIVSEKYLKDIDKLQCNKCREKRTD